jgi:hypothetical protein
MRDQGRRGLAELIEEFFEGRNGVNCVLWSRQAFQRANCSVTAAPRGRPGSPEGAAAHPGEAARHKKPYSKELGTGTHDDGLGKLGL